VARFGPSGAWTASKLLISVQALRGCHVLNLGTIAQFRLPGVKLLAHKFRRFDREDCYGLANCRLTIRGRRIRTEHHTSRG
jgi:hypothetical protein